ncbi:mersacidin/lichenicidin family type 2 lantibiotic [Thermoflavimicrobium dichotomicum]|uniref:Type 2 lantibiotic, mersacidin/lichenicidin family n=1 Tax=Thermoflavimicrobium dichotomicum TaxID=46223 RepID=A0A1I3SLM3_9BACL|nr:mersacidin/lichenicidin family type 2 lantibiotic [Thermoflavimicrobium dichotomicum]SFJ59645.1 type 2 lantibiotic, mersacidin/lichenicidin family [Thermoflavimicrobium dichotomicum]
MTKMVKSWVDPVYRASLSAEEKAAMPVNPAGDVFAELSDAELTNIAGAGCGEVCSWTKDCAACPSWSCWNWSCW